MRSKGYRLRIEEPFFCIKIFDKRNKKHRKDKYAFFKKRKEGFVVPLFLLLLFLLRKNNKEQRTTTARIFYLLSFIFYLLSFIFYLFLVVVCSFYVEEIPNKRRRVLLCAAKLRILLLSFRSKSKI